MAAKTSNFGVRRRASIFAADVGRRLFDRHRHAFYSQYGEDLVVKWLMREQPIRYYVDVGCNKPIQKSNTYLFYRSGAHGVAIDGNPDFAAEFARERPRDRFICACVSDQQREVEFKVYADNALSSMTDIKLFDSPDQYSVDRIDRVTTRTIDSVLAEVGAPNEFCLLSIDVESADFEALRSIDLHHYNPKIIVIEDHAAKPAALGESEIAQYLAPYGYDVRAYHGGNMFFTKR